MRARPSSGNGRRGGGSLLDSTDRVAGRPSALTPDARVRRPATLPANEPKPPKSQRALRPAQFLLVDDDPTLRRALKRVIEAACPHWQVVPARHGEHALECLARERFDVVMLDLHMPIMDGLCLLERMRLDYPESVRIVHSSHTDMLRRAPPDAAHCVLPKPATAQKIITVLQWALERRGAPMGQAACVTQDGSRKRAFCA